MSNPNTGAQNPIGRLPKWAQFAIFIAVLFPVIFAFQYVKDSRRDSPEARKMKKEMTAIAEKFDDAVKVGDRGAVIPLFESAMEVQEYYKKLLAERPEIKDKPLHYCGLASNHLVYITASAASTGKAEGSPSQYREALSRCK